MLSHYSTYTGRVVHFIIFYFYIIKVDREDLKPPTCLMNINRRIIMRYPTKFYGVPMSGIRTEAQALAALDQFIKNASDEEVSEAIHELEHMNRPVRSVIRSLLWKLEYELDSQEWLRCFNLKYASA